MWATDFYIYHVNSWMLNHTKTSNNVTKLVVAIYLTNESSAAKCSFLHNELNIVSLLTNYKFLKPNPSFSTNFNPIWQVFTLCIIIIIIIIIILIIIIIITITIITIIVLVIGIIIIFLIKPTLNTKTRQINWLQ